MLVLVDKESESWGHDIGSWGMLDGGSSKVLAGVSGGGLDGESWGAQDEVSCGASSAMSWGVQTGQSLDNVGKSPDEVGESLDRALGSHGIEGELSLLGSTCSKGSGSPITWHMASTCLTSFSC